MAGEDLVRPSRDGDQFHYLWAARQCLELLPGGSDLVAVTVEGVSTREGSRDDIEDGEELIDVGLYFGDESREKARLIRYVQLKHSTRRAGAAWTASGLEKTIRGFAGRYAELVKRFPVDDVARRFRFAFSTNRQIDVSLQEACADLGSGSAARHPELRDTLVKFTTLGDIEAAWFFSLFSLEGGEADLWAQRNLLSQDISGYLPDADCDAPVQLKELVTRNATTEFKSDPSIRRHDVLRALKATEELLQPARCLIPDASNALVREQESDVRGAILTATVPVVIHADAGVGKSVLAARLAASMPDGSEAVLYDCFGDGLYRNALNFRHRHRDALVQIANELAARGLCHPLIASAHADAKRYMRALLYRLNQAATVLRARKSAAILCIIVDAADNAEMAAEEQKEPGSFVRDLIRAPLPNGVRLLMTCRSHRRERLAAPHGTAEIELRPFSLSESARHLRGTYPLADGRDVAEFAYLSSSNPRVQALAIAQRLTLPEMLKRLGPTPTTVEAAIGDLLQGAIARLRDKIGPLEAMQIDEICRGLAVLRPLVPIPVLAKLSDVPESAIRSFALDLGRPLSVRGESLHFLDEPAETWFREHYQPDAKGLAAFLERLRPLAAHSSYVAAALPQLLLQAGRLDELVALALSTDALPTNNPLERRDVELQRLNFALKASLRAGRYIAAAKLALKAGGECAGEQRQANLIQTNTDLAAALLAPDRIAELVSRRTFGASWIGSHHAYDAGLLSGREELAPEASSRLRMAMDWLVAWARRAPDERERGEVTNADRAELALVLLRLRGPAWSARFLRGWHHRRLAFAAGALLARRLVDLGRYDQLDALAAAARNDVWLLLALAQEAHAEGRLLPQSALARLLRLLIDRRVKLPDAKGWNENWSVLYAITATVEIALRVLAPQPKVWADLIRRYLPSTPPSDLCSPFGFDRARLLCAYALEAALRGQTLTLIDVAPAGVRAELQKAQSYSRSQDADIFLREVGGLLPWATLSADISCGRAPTDLGGAIKAALGAAAQGERHGYRKGSSLKDTVAKQWLRILVDVGATSGPALDTFSAWKQSQKDPLWPGTLTALSRCAARARGLQGLARDLASEAYSGLEATREDAGSRSDAYVSLARAIYTVSASEAGAYFDRAVEIASRIGDENLDRWAALLHLAGAAAQPGRPNAELAYRLSRVAELTYEYVARDKHFPWTGTVKALADLCPCSAFAILSRWRDRRFGRAARLLPIAIYRLVELRQLPQVTPIALAGLDAEWERLVDLKRFLASEAEATWRARGAKIAYRYMRTQPYESATWSQLRDLANAYVLDLPGIERLLTASLAQSKGDESPSEPFAGEVESKRRNPDWEAVFKDVDVTASEALRAAYDAMRTYDPPYDINGFFREACARVVPGREADFVRAIVAWPDFDLYRLRWLVDGCPQAWHKWIAFRRAVRDAILTACRRNPARAQRHGWGQLIPFEAFFADGVVSERDVIQATLAGYTEQVDTLGAGDLFRLVDPLAASLTADEAREALTFGLDLLEDILRAEDGDGPWRADLAPPTGLIPALAGYLWAGLASPVAAERWEYAHAVRAVVELGWADLLNALLACAESGGAACFVDQRLEFYLWHAREWLLAGLARGGMESATALRPAVPMLLRLVADNHVVVRELAAQCLQALAAAGEPGSDGWGTLDFVNRSPLPVKIYSGWSDAGDNESEPVHEALSEGDKYYFGIDIGPYWLAPLGRVFGITEEGITLRALNVLRHQIGWHRRGWQDDARRTLRIFQDRETAHSHGSLPATDDLSAYHGYHAMMLLAGTLLKERPVRRRAEEALDEFQNWLVDYLLTRPDNRWLADRRDPHILRDPAPPRGYRDSVWRWCVSADYLDRQLSAEDGMTVLWGYWTAGDDDHRETISVHSALVSEQGAEALLAALQTAPELGRFALPAAGGSRDIETPIVRLTGWVNNEALSRGLDASDPWSDGLRYPGPHPARQVVDGLAIVPEDDGRLWRGAEGAMLRSETWLRPQGYGREMENVPGSRLCANPCFFEALFRRFRGHRLILSVEVSRDRPRHSGSKDDFHDYSPPYTRFYLMGSDGVAISL
jgi:hypothetical protein